MNNETPRLLAIIDKLHAAEELCHLLELAADAASDNEHSRDALIRGCVTTASKIEEARADIRALIDTECGVH